MKKQKVYFFSILLGLVFLLGSFPDVYAQETPAEEFTLEEITVTAEKREVDIQKTAMEIKAITGAELDSRAVYDISKILEDLAGVDVMGGAQGTKVFIRGIGSSMDTNQGSPAVTLQMDGVYLGNSEAYGGAVYDVERVEVLFGPQGTMYGKNAAGGTVNVVTKDPTDKFEASANLSVGEYSLAHWNAVLNVPLSSKFATRIGVEKQRRDGFISDGSGDANKFSTRVKLSYKPTDKISFLWTSNYWWDKSRQVNSVILPGSAGNLPLGRNWAVPDEDGDGVADDFLTPNPDNPGYFLDEPNGIPDIVDTGWIRPYGGDAWTNDEWHPSQKNDYRYQLHELQIDLDMGWSKLTLIPTVNKNYRMMFSDFHTGIAEGSDRISRGMAFEETQFTGEGRLQSAEDFPFVWILGGYWWKSNNHDIGQVYTDLMDSARDTWETGGGGGGPGGPPPPGGPGGGGEPYTSDNIMNGNYRTPQDSWAVFALVTYPVTDRFRVTGSARKNIDHNKTKYRLIIYNVTQDGIWGTDPSVDGYLTNLYDQTVEVQDPTAPGGVRHVYDTGIVNYTVDTSPITYKGGVEFDVDKDKMLYAFVTTGYKNGGLNVLTLPVPYDPEKVTAYTIGSKNRFMGNRMQLNAEAYYYDYTGMQVMGEGQFYDALRKMWVQRMMIYNAKKGISSGVDLSGDFLITDRDRVSVSLSYNRSEYGELVLGPNMMAGFDGYCDLTGTKLARVPDWVGSISYQRMFTLDSGATITPRLQTRISTGLWTTHEKYLAGAWQPGFRTSNFDINYTSPSGQYSVTLWGKNLENSVVTTYVWPCYRRTIMDPRNTGITFSVRF